ncbi:MAG: hypothetical protein ABUT39_08440 [Acidobacteriota bacterium]
MITDRFSQSTFGQEVDGTTLDQRDLAILANVPPSLANGLRALEWWRGVERGQVPVQRFPLVRTFNPADVAFGYFGELPLPDRRLPVMGVFQEMFYDRPKGDGVLGYRDQLREFVLRYFMRVSDFKRPEAWVPGQRTSDETCLPLLSWCPDPGDPRAGFGYSQLYYKLAASGEIGKFPPERRSRIVDLRQIGPVYEWIVVEVEIFAFNLTFQPLGSNLPYVELPMREKTLVILSRELIRDSGSSADHGSGLLGRYGLGYALLRDPTAGLLAYGPGQFDVGCQLIDFKIFEDGRIQACLTFVVNRPQQILNLSLNPLSWGVDLADLMSMGMASRLFAPLRQAMRPSGQPDGFDPIFTFIALANLLSGGRAAQDLCISRDRLEMDMLLQHFQQHYDLISGSLMTWRSVGDWLDRSAIPDWILQGRLV